MKPWLGSKAWLLGLVFIFFIGNLMFWTYNSRETCDENGNCVSYEQHTSVDNKDEASSSSPFHPDSPQQDQQPPPPPPPDIPQPPPPPPPPPVPVPPPPPAEAHLEPVLFQNNQPIKPPKTYMPGQHPASTKDLPLVAPTADQITMRLKDGNALAYAERLESWNIGLINTKPDVFIASEGHLVDIDRHYEREHRIYTLMKWILRVYRRDPTRTQPLLMVDAGSNHGLFSMVASASGAHTIAFEPQTNLRSVIGLGARLNQVSPRLRVLPFAVLDKFRKVSMSNYNVNDGGIGFLDFANQNTIMQTQTIRLDTLPAFDKLFTGTDKTLINSPQEIDAAYAKGLEASTDNNGVAIGSLKNASSLLRQPIHFLKIDVEGFELQALDSASELFAAGLVEHCVLEFGPPNRWDVTEQGLSTQEEVRKKTITHAKQVLHRVTQEWDMDIYLLPAIGWDRTVQWMMDRDVDYSKNMPNKNKIVHYLKSWDFDGKPQEGDEFERELEGKQQIVTETIPLLDEHIDGYMDDLESIGEMYLWFAKRSGNKAVMSKLEL